MLRTVSLPLTAGSTSLPCLLSESSSHPSRHACLEPSHPYTYENVMLKISGKCNGLFRKLTLHFLLQAHQRHANISQSFAIHALLRIKCQTLFLICKLYVNSQASCTAMIIPYSDLHLLLSSDVVKNHLNPFLQNFIMKLKLA